MGRVMIRGAPCVRAHAERARCFSAWLVAAAAVLSAGHVRADAAPAEWRSTEYYVVNGAVAAGLVGGQLLIRWASAELQAGGDTVWFPGDAGLRGQCSPEAANLSDVSLSLAVALPIGSELAGTSGARFVNAEVVYTQALLVNALLTSAAKAVFRRPRPFSYQKDRRCAFDFEAADMNRSFFSGHSSTAFAAAFSGSLLLSERGFPSWSRSATWGTELALAGATANLRARAGKHYYSDILVGTLVGAGVGIAVPVLHGADDGPSSSDVLAGAIGLTIGVVGSQLVALGAEAIDPGDTLGLVLSPMLEASAVGLLGSGRW
jgi:membrane-associated phospholipid phosphatase